MQEAEDDQRNCCTPENGSADAAHVVRGDEELCLCAGMVWAENQSNYVRRVTEEGNVVECCGWGWTGNLHWHARDVAGSSLGVEALEPSFQHLPPCWLTVNESRVYYLASRYRGVSSQNRTNCCFSSYLATSHWRMDDWVEDQDRL